MSPITIRDLIVAALKKQGIEVVVEEAKYFGLIWHVKKQSGKLKLFVDNEVISNMEVGRIKTIKAAIEAAGKLSKTEYGDLYSYSCQIRSDGMWISAFVPNSVLIDEREGAV